MPEPGLMHRQRETATAREQLDARPERAIRATASYGFDRHGQTVPRATDSGRAQHGILPDGD